MEPAKAKVASIQKAIDAKAKEKAAVLKRKNPTANDKKAVKKIDDEVRTCEHARAIPAHHPLLRGLAPPSLGLPYVHP